MFTHKQLYEFSLTYKELNKNIYKVLILHLNLEYQVEHDTKSVVSIISRAIQQYKDLRKKAKPAILILRRCSTQ